MRVAYFTAGTVGAGHLVRGEALRRALARAGFTGVYQTFGPQTPFEGWISGSHTRVDVRGDPLLADPATAPSSSLGQALLGWRPDLVIVDMFWAPVRHLLAQLGCPAWLLVRACPPVWLTGAGETRFDAGSWERIIAIEPIGARVFSDHIDPIVVINPDECEPVGSLRGRLDIEEQPLVVVSHAGEPGERAELDALARAKSPPGAHVLSLDPQGSMRGLFPAARWLGDADLVVAGAGYNSFWEAQWLGRNTRTEFLAFPRSIDRQHFRLEHLREHTPTENGADTLAHWLCSGG